MKGSSVASGALLHSAVAGGCAVGAYASIASGWRRSPGTASRFLSSLHLLQI